jgi:hypothetical protein
MCLLPFYVPTYNATDGRHGRRTSINLGWLYKDLIWHVNIPIIVIASGNPHHCPSPALTILGPAIIPL